VPAQSIWQRRQNVFARVLEALEWPVRLLSGVRNCNVPQQGFTKCWQGRNLRRSGESSWRLRLHCDDIAASFLVSRSLHLQAVLQKGNNNRNEGQESSNDRDDDSDSVIRRTFVSHFAEGLGPCGVCMQGCGSCGAQDSAQAETLARQALSGG
jgi:hypothetical protein